MDPAAARRFVEGQELAAARIDRGRDAVRDAAALMDALATLGELNPEILRLRAADEEVVRARWDALRRALLDRK